MSIKAACLASALTALLTGTTGAATIALTPTRDNSVYGESADKSNGSGTRLFAGKNGSFHTRRALLAFDIAGAIPAGSTITAATLTLNVSQSPNVATLDCHEFTLHRLLASWGEGASDAGGPEGFGAPAEIGDATWNHRFYDSVPWSLPGGDFVTSASASAEVAGNGLYDWETTSTLVADVQEWLDDPVTNHGWILIGDEFDLQTARRFDSRENAVPEVRPRLTVEFDAPPAASGAVPDGDAVPGVPLRLSTGAVGTIRLSWSASCRPNDVDYHVYEGTLGDFDSHVVVVCSTSGATQAVFSPQSGSAYYVVVPTDGVVEGSYGRDSEDLERVPGPGSCTVQILAAPVCP